MPRYLFVRCDGWTRYVDVPQERYEWVLRERDHEPRFQSEVPPCTAHTDCITNAEMAYECSRSRLVSPPSVMVHERRFEKHEFQGVPWSDDRNRGRRTFIFLEVGLRPDDFVQRWQEFPT